MTRATLIHHINIPITDRDRSREWYARVLGATFLDRGTALNKRQLQLNIGSSEIHFNDVKEIPPLHPRMHFAVEIEDWEGMLEHLHNEGIENTRTGRGAFVSVGLGDAPDWARREDSGEFYTYIHDPDGNMIELVHHPLGLVDLDGNEVELVNDPQGLRWRQMPEVEEALGKTKARV